MEHKFLTEKTKNYLNIYFKDKNSNEFVKSQKDRMKKTSTFFFSFPFEKQNTTLNQFAKMYEFDSNKKVFNDIDREDVCNLHYPETEYINYSEYSNEKFFKNDLFAKEYKDGILLVSNSKVEKIKAYGSFRIADCIKKNTINGKVILSLHGGLREKFTNLGQINWQDKKFDKQVTLYFVFPSYSKNKAIKIILKNNKIKQLIDYFRENEPVELSEENRLFIRSKSSTIDFLLQLRLKEKYGEHYGDIKDKNIFLKYGYDSALIRLNNILAYRYSKEEGEIYDHSDFKKKQIIKI